MFRALLASLSLLALLLAGCAAGPSSELPGSGAAAPAAGMGRLEGAIVNDGFVGVPGAIVQILGSANSRKADLDGRFVFAEVPAGTHVLRVEAPGWVPAQVRTTIEERATTQVTIFLDPLLTAEPYSDMFTVRGKLRCIGVRIISTSTEGMACDLYRRDLGFPEEWAGAVTEVTWSKGVTSTPYSRVSLLQKNSSTEPAYARQIAESPARMVLRPGTLHTQYQGDVSTPPKHEAGPLFVEVMKAGVQQATLPVYAGLTVEEEFQLYHTTFYVSTPESIDDYSALPKE